MHRLFVALPIPDALRQELALTRGGLEKARWVDPADYHITLRFIGDVDMPLANAVAGRLALIEAAPFEISVQGYDFFGSGEPRLVHLRIAASPGLVSLQHKVEQACREAGLDPEGRKFSPHVTIARIRGAKASAVGHWLSSRLQPLTAAFYADHFALYTARRGGGGPYHAEHRYELSG